MTLKIASESASAALFLVSRTNSPRNWGRAWWPRTIGENHYGKLSQFDSYSLSIDHTGGRKLSW